MRFKLEWEVDTMAVIQIGTILRTGFMGLNLVFNLKEMHYRRVSAVVSVDTERASASEADVVAPAAQVVVEAEAAEESCLVPSVKKNKGGNKRHWVKS